MKRAVGATFLVFYAAFTIVAVSEHTAAFASTIARHSPAHTKTIRGTSPHSSQVRILPDSFVGLQVGTSVALRDNGRTSVRPASPRFEIDSNRFTPTRAPPASL